VSELCTKRRLDVVRDRADTASRLAKVARAEKVSAAHELLALQGAQEQLMQDHDDIVNQLAVMKRTISSSSVKERQFERLASCKGAVGGKGVAPGQPSCSCFAGGRYC